MDYAPTSLYNNPNYYWPVIDDALRTAAYKYVSLKGHSLMGSGVKVDLLFAKWNHTKTSSYQWMRSLAAIDNINVLLYDMPRS